MPVHIPPSDSRLAVSFYRDREPPETLIARDGANAWQHAIYLLTRRKELQHGDTLRICLLAEAGPLVRTGIVREGSDADTQNHHDAA
jgi:hypothetical protein